MQSPKLQKSRVFLKRTIKNNPKIVEKYVNAGIIAAHLLVLPLNALLKHLIEIQEIDPSGRIFGSNLKARLDQLFNEKHDKSYDDDFSWEKMHFKQTQARMPDLTEKQFRKLTDLNDLGSVKDSHATPNLGPTTSFTKSESGVPLTIDHSPIDELQVLLGEPVDQIAPKPVEQERENEGGGFIKFGLGHPDYLEPSKDKEDIFQPDIKEALTKLVEIAKHLGKEDDAVDVKDLIERTELLKLRKQAIKTSEKPSRPLKRECKVKRGAEYYKTPPKSTLKKSLEKGLKEYRAKLPAAQELAKEMVRCGLCEDNEKSIRTQIDEIMKYDDKAFDSLREIIMSLPISIKPKSKE